MPIQCVMLCPVAPPTALAMSQPICCAVDNDNVVPTIPEPIAPTLIGMVPNTSAINVGDLPVLVNGGGFVSGAVVFFAGVPLAATFLSDVQLMVTVVTTGQTVGAKPVSVRNPDDLESGAIAFTFT